MSVVKLHWVVNPADTGIESCEFTGGLDGETRGVIAEWKEGELIQEALEFGPKINSLLQGLTGLLQIPGITPEAVLRIGVWSE